MVFLAFIVMLVIYTFLLKKKFSMSLFEVWTTAQIHSKPALYLMPVIPVALSAVTVAGLLFFGVI